MRSEDQPLIDVKATPFVSTDIVRLRILSPQHIGVLVSVRHHLKAERGKFCNQVLGSILVGSVALARPPVPVTLLPVERIEGIGRVGYPVEPLVDLSAMDYT